MRRIPVYSIVAYSGTGKTTLMVKLIAELTRRGLRVAAVKHDAHAFEIDREGKDSFRFTQAGAEVTVLASRTQSAVMHNRHVPLEALIKNITGVDLILTEGYKNGPWPKIALSRAGTAFPVPPDECFAVMSDTPVTARCPCLDINDFAALAALIAGDMPPR